MAQTQYNMSDKDKKITTIIGATVVALIILVVGGFVGFSFYKNYQDTHAMQEQYTKYSALVQKNRPLATASDGAIIVTARGVVTDETEAEKKLPQVDTYIDFLCPGCGALDRALTNTYIQRIKANNMVLRIHPISILDSLSTDKYSTRASASVYRLMDINPEVAFTYITYLLSSDFQPQEGSEYKSVSNDKLIEAGVKSGLTQAQAKNIVDGKYTNFVADVTGLVTHTSYLLNSNGTFSTPVITINNTQENIAQYNSTSDFVKAFDSKIASLNKQAIAVKSYK